MASAFLSPILSRTSQLVLGCVRRWAISPSSSSDPRSSVQKDLKELENTLKKIQAVLHDAEEREIRDEAVKLWLEDLKEVAYDAEDLLDDYHYEELRAQAEGRASLKRKRVEGDDEEEVSGSLSTIVVSIPDGMGDRIREIRERFDHISEIRERLRLREEDGERRVLGAPNPPPTSHMVVEYCTFGREHDKKKVIDLLLSEGRGNVISVIPIVGKGGLGKTTITQLVYNDSKVKQYFDLTGWVCVSDDFDVTRLTKEIIESLTRKSCDLTLLSTLQDTLMEEVKGKKVLLVLDDVWNEQQSSWESLTRPFVGAETVRIIMTCRNDKVAKIMQTVPPHYPECLLPEQSWSLFSHYAFGDRDPQEQPRQLADIGKQIVEKCSGLPLAVKTMGSLLRHETDEDRWMEVLQSDLWELEENKEILGSLRLSYSRMPAHLKPCFVYCSMFPKDYPYNKNVLVRLWMAQGYIPSGGGRRMEDVGHEYFNDLLRRSFFDSFYGKYKMHDLIHDLAKFIAGNECYAIVDEKVPDSPEKVRHLYLEGTKELVKSLSSYNLRALRTWLPRNQFGQPMVIQEMTQFLPLLRCLRVLRFSWEKDVEIPDLLGNLKHLRYLCIHSILIKKLPESVCHLYHLQTLIVENLHLAELPSGIDNLKHLRYLSIKSGFIKKLPESVCDLYHLQTLIVQRPGNIVELPNGIGSLTNLRYLNIPCTFLPVGIRKLTNLQTLRTQRTVHDSIRKLKQLVDLPVLCISGLRNVVNIEDAKDAGLKHKHQLQWLSLCWNAGVYGGRWAHLPVHLSNKLLHLNAFPEESKDAGLKHKHQLQWLSLSWNAGGGRRAHLPGHLDNKLLHLNAFPEESKDVPTDEKREEAMLEYLQPHANLKTLVINGYGGSKFPKWVGNLCSLENLHIYKCPQLRLLSGEGLPSKHLGLHVEDCQQLTSLPEMQNLTSLEELTIQNCPQLRLLSEEGLPSKLRNLYIEDCQQLTSLQGMQNLTSLGSLGIKNCPILQIMAEGQLSSMPYNVLITDCPGLSNWCEIQKINCCQVISGNKMTISNAWENIKQWFNDITSTEHGFDESSTSSDELLQPRSHLSISKNWDTGFWGTRGSVLEELTIWSCTHIPALWHLSEDTSLHRLVIKDCPGVELLPDELLPSTLKSLVVDSCENLRSLQLAQENRDALEELQIVNCPKLEMVEGLKQLFFPKFLRIEGCPQLPLSQED